MNLNCCLGIVAAAAVWMGPRPAIGYLTRVGPAPLRFHAPPKAPEEMMPLPPLAMKDPEPEPEVYGPPPPADWTPPPTPVVQAQAQPTVVAPQMAPTDPTAGLTPQMLIQFFNDRKGSNQDYNVVVPYQFNPPPATSIPAPPSRATYIKQ
jgi:hypothetical protein